MKSKKTVKSKTEKRFEMLEETIERINEFILNDLSRAISEVGCVANAVDQKLENLLNKEEDHFYDPSSFRH